MHRRRPKARLEGICSESYTTLRLRTARPDGLRSQQAPNGLRKPLRLGARMWPESSAMQSFGRGRRHKILLRQSEAVTRRRSFFPGRTATDPKQPCEIDACRGGRDGIERVASIDPGTHLRCLRHPRNKGKRNRGSPRTLGADKFAHRSHGEPSLEHFVQRFNAGGCNRPHHLRRGCQGRGDLLRERRFDLDPDCGGCRHS